MTRQSDIQLQCFIDNSIAINVLTLVCAVESKASALAKFENEMVETTAGTVAFVLTVVFELLLLATPASIIPEVQIAWRCT